MITVLAEKPSVAREVAALLGAKDKKAGYLEGNGYYVTWAIGHLVALGMPEDYGIKGFQRENIPILPPQYMLIPRKGSGKNSQLPDKGILKQLITIGELFAKSKEIIVATDAGREGELIFRYIYDYLKCTTPFKRLWVSSLTETALKKGFDNLLPGSAFDNLYLAARARSRADWLVGINATQSLSIAAGSGVYSLGRVQTPTLALICQRFLEHRGFTVKKYWQVELSLTKSFVDFRSQSLLRWEDQKQAQDALKSIERKKVAVADSVQSKTVTDTAPLLFDLTGLQKAANAKFGMTAAETLEIAQKLYENKFITYPRTGSNYITEDLWEELPKRIRQLDTLPAFKEPVSALKFSRLNRHIVNSAKVTDHHGLLITDKVPSALTTKESLIYQMIAFRLLEAVSENCTREVTDIALQVLHYDFAAKSSKMTEPGWRGIQGDFTGAGDAADTLPELKEGDEIPIREVAILEKETRPPQLYTDAGLLGAMENAGNSIDEAGLKKAIQGGGLGTPATRAAIIEALFTRDYISRKGKSLVPSDKGLKVYELVKDKKIASVMMTAEWETALAKIEEGGYSSEAFQKEIEGYTAVISRELLESIVVQENVPQLLCPKCKSRNLLINEKVAKCPESNCNWIQWRSVCGKQLSVEDIENLVLKKQTSLLKGLKSKAGKLFDARLVLNDAAEVSFAFSK
jgi:DNA topoisomerase-3